MSRVLIAVAAAAMLIVCGSGNAGATTLANAGAALAPLAKSYRPTQQVYWRRYYRRGYYGYGYPYGYGYAYRPYGYYGGYPPYGYYGYGWRPGISIGIGPGWGWRWGY
jgi:hypothetical protein